MSPIPRFIIGISRASGLTSFSDGDLFQRGLTLFRLCRGSTGWSLRETIKADDYRTDYSTPPLEGWIEIPNTIALAEKLNLEADRESARHEKFAQFSQNCTTASKAIRQHANNKRGVVGELGCPICKTGTLKYSISGYNGHVASRCSTPGCVSWIE